jgi:hypothetical protein
MDVHFLAVIGAPPMGSFAAIRFEFLKARDPDAELDHVDHRVSSTLEYAAAMDPSGQARALPGAVAP